MGKIPFTFKNGLTLINNVPCLILTLNVGLLLYQKLYEGKEYKEHKKDKIVEITQWIGINEKIPLSEELPIFLDKLKYYGYGTFKAIQLSNNKITIKNTHPIYHNTYLKLIKEKIPGLTFIEDIILYYIQIKTKKNSSITQQLKKDMLYLSINIEETQFIKKPNSPIKYEAYTEKYNSLLIKVIKNQQLKIINGNLIIWNMRINAIPFHLFDYKKKSNIQLQKIFFNLGMEQGKTAVEFQIKKTGKNNNEEILFAILGESEFVGMGVIKEKKFNEKEKEFVFTMQNQFLETNELQWYLLGLFQGAMEELFKQKSKGKIINNKYQINIINKEINPKKENELLKLNKVVNVS